MVVYGWVHRRSPPHHSLLDQPRQPVPFVLKPPAVSIVLPHISFKATICNRSTDGWSWLLQLWPRTVPKMTQKGQHDLSHFLLSYLPLPFCCVARTNSNKTNLWNMNRDSTTHPNPTLRLQINVFVVLYLELCVGLWVFGQCGFKAKICQFLKRQFVTR